MAWRSVLISQPAKLSLLHQQLRVEQEGGHGVTVPLEDISVLVLETPQALLTTALLAALAEANVAVLTCDASHHPNGVLLSFLPHSRQTLVLHQQLALTLPQKKRAWQRVVAQKLTNQAAVLAAYPAAGAALLTRLARSVRPGDPDNLESQGAQHYFVSLWGRGFSRAGDYWVNSAMNYGYTVVRAALARSLVGYGLLPALGLHHSSTQNAFNLVDDLIEPFRPVLDWGVLQLAHQLGDTDTVGRVAGPLLPSHKAALIKLLYTEVALPSGQMTVLAAVEHCAMSMGQWVATGGRTPLALPRVLLPAAPPCCDHDHE